MAIEDIVKKFGANTGISRVISEFKKDPEALRNHLTSQIHNYEITYNGQPITLYELAKQKGAEEKLNNYINNNILSGLSWHLNTIHYNSYIIKESVKDIGELAELHGALMAAPSGLGSVAINVGSTVLQVPVYVVLETIYSAIAAVAGFSTYKSVFDYTVDMGKGYASLFISTIPIIGSIHELSTLPADPRERIAHVSTIKTRNWLLNELNIEMKPKSLFDRLSPVKEKLETKFVEYKDAASDLLYGHYRNPIYSH